MTTPPTPSAAAKQLDFKIVVEDCGDERLARIDGLLWARGLSGFGPSDEEAKDILIEALVLACDSYIEDVATLERERDEERARKEYLYHEIQRKTPARLLCPDTTIYRFNWRYLSSNLTAHEGPTPDAAIDAGRTTT